MPQDDARTLIEDAARRSMGEWSLTDLDDVRWGVRGVSASAVLVRRDGSRVGAFVKVNHEDEGCFRRESAAARLLDGIGLLPEIAPKLLLTAESSSLIVWQAVDALPLSAALEGDDPRAASAALSTLSDALATLHTRTASLSERTEAVLLDRAGEEASALRDGTERISALLRALGEAPPSDLAETIQAVAAAHEADGPLVALTHGDQAPSNVLLRSSGEAILVDLEYAAFRPMLYDLATWTTLCPLPVATVAGMLGRYRAALARAVPEASTAAFERGWALACFRALSMATWFGEGLARENRPWGDGYDRRSALATALGRAAYATRGLDDLQDMHELLRGLDQAARRAWDVQILRWPALE